VPQVRLDIIIDAAQIKSLLKDIKNSNCNFKGKGIYWVTNIDEYGEL